MASYSYAVPAATSLAAIANNLPTTTSLYVVRDGDTIVSVALALGVTADELAFHNANLAAALGNVDIDGSRAAGGCDEDADGESERLA